MRCVIRGLALPALTLVWVLTLVAMARSAPADGQAIQPPEGWSAQAPRDEVRPAFSYRPGGGPDRSGSLAWIPTVPR